MTPVLDFGGVESRVVLQARSMAHAFEEFRVCCFTNAGSAAAEVRSSGVPVDVLGVEPSVRNARATYRLWRYLRSIRPDIVHACTGAMTVHGMIAATAARVPVRICEEVGIPRRGRAGRLLFPFVYRLATKVIAVSDAVATYLVRSDGVPPHKVVRVYNAIDDSYFEETSRASGSALRVITVGRLADSKGHDLLLMAIAALPKEADVELTLVGDGPLRSRLVANADRLGVLPHVAFLGFRRDVARLLQSADVFVLPSTSEGFGLALVEAMAAGLPVIATDAGGVPEILGDVAPEWIVKAGDHAALALALARMADMSAEERAALGARLREHARARFNREVYVASLGQLYTSELSRLGT